MPCVPYLHEVLEIYWNLQVKVGENPTVVTSLLHLYRPIRYQSGVHVERLLTLKAHTGSDSPGPQTSFSSIAVTIVRPAHGPTFWQDLPHSHVAICQLEGWLRLF